MKTTNMSDLKDHSVAIIGAGFGGLAAAYDLIRRGVKVTIYDGSAQAGGLAAGFKEPGWEWSVEKFYHHWFQTDKHILKLMKELGWMDRIMFPRPLTVMYDRGKF
jgi:protoporphyrinogen oxidase